MKALITRPAKLAIAIAVLSTLFIFPSLSFAKFESGMDASVVLGQPDFTSGTANNGGIGPATISNARRVHSDGKRLYVADGANNRVLIWNSIPTTHFAPADVVVGEPDFVSTNGGGGRSPSSLSNPSGIATDGQRLFIAEQNSHRILIWNSIPTTNGAPADVVVGQPSFTSGTANNGGRGAATLNSPRSVSSDGKRLFVADLSNNRVLIWNTIPTTNFAPADVVLGQQDFSSATANNGGRGAATLNAPNTVFSDGTRLVVADGTNNRVLIWNTIPTANFTPADVVLGQPDFTSGTANTGGRSASTFNSPLSCPTDGKRLFVAESGSSRVLIWNTIPTANFTPADVVLGQPDFVSGTANNGGLGSATVSAPAGVAMDGNRVFVGDGGNNRVLIFNISTVGVKLGPQFEQGKAVLGKVFEDLNGNGMQDKGEKGIEGVKVASDTGIYAITDEDGKYHFPYIETGQRLLKLDPSTLPEGAQITTESPRKIVVTKGILTKVSFGVKLPAPAVIASEAKQSGLKQQIASSQPSAPPSNDTLLKVSISQDPVLLKPVLSMQAKEEEGKIIFTIECNYDLFIERSEITLYDKNLKPFKTIELPKPLPLEYEIERAVILSAAKNPGDPSASARPQDDRVFYYQLSVYDKQGRQDRTGVGEIKFVV